MTGGVLSVVEHGWRGARECSIRLSAMRTPVTHLIKGDLHRSVRMMIRPYPSIQIASVPRRLFRIGLWGLVVWRTLTGRLRWVLLDHERTGRELAWWCRRFGIIPVTITETEAGYELRVHGHRRPLADVFASSRSDAPGAGVR